MQTRLKTAGSIVFILGILSLILAPLIGHLAFDSLWTVEPLTYIGAVLAAIGLGVVSISYTVYGAINKGQGNENGNNNGVHSWSEVTQRYFDLFDHDLGRPIRRISGKERELRAVLKFAGADTDPNVQALLDEIEMQTPNFRLMMSNIQVLVQLEGPDRLAQPQPVEPS